LSKNVDPICGKRGPKRTRADSDPSVARDSRAREVHEVPHRTYGRSAGAVGRLEGGLQSVAKQIQ